MISKKVHSAPIFSLLLKFLGFSVVLFFFSTSSFGQNTKGDRPVRNERQIRETRAKSYKRKEKRKTRDIAGRRLRTRNQSSANRASARYPQPSPYSGGSKKHKEKAARPLGRVFSKSPRESRTHAWRGDISGYPIKRIKPSRSEAARSNVYPQEGPYYRKRPPKERQEKRVLVSRNIRGRRVGHQKPRPVDRAWKGGVDRGPLRNQSATGSVRNVFSQKGPYVAHYRKRQDKKEKRVSNKRELSLIRKFSHTPNTGGAQGGYQGAVSRPFILRGKKNVYWGKFSKKEKPFTRDITGGPLRTRNYKSSPAGLVGRDTLKFFGRKPFGDRRTRRAGKGYITATGVNRGWKGDIAGWRLRKTAKNNREVRGPFVFPRLLSISRKGEQSDPKIPGGGYKSRTTKGEKAQFKSVPAIFLETDLGGRLKGPKRPKVGALSTSRRLWNNKGQPIFGKVPGLGSFKAARFAGTFRQDQARSGFSRQGADFSGNIKRSSVRGFSRDGVEYSGKMKRSQLRGFSTNGVNYSGKIKRSQLRGFSSDGVDYSGRIRRGSIPGFSSEGVNYSGKIKRSHTRGFSTEGIEYSGNVRRGEIRGFSSDEAGYSGNIRRPRPEKGGGSVSGLVWNNRKQPITQNLITPESIRALRFSGNTPYLEFVKTFQDHGEGYSGRIKRSQVRAFGQQGADFAGNIKMRRPEKGGGSVSGQLWNNDKKPIEVRIPGLGGSSVANYSGRTAHSRFKQYYIENPNSSKMAIRKRKPGQATYLIAGIHTKVRQRDYDRNPNSAALALKVISPGKATARIRDYQGNVKMHKYSGSQLHPDAQFAHGFRDNVKEERTLLMNVRLIWSKLFRKSETQPENLKEKVRRPRYDKREKGLWYD